MNARDAEKQFLTEAVELAQVHELETSVLDRCCEDVFDLAPMLTTALARAHVLIYIYIEAPNAEHAHRFIRASSKLRSIARASYCHSELERGVSNKGLGLSR